MTDAKTLDNDWRQRVEDKLSDIQINVAKLSETQVTGPEVDAKVNTRVATETYASDMRGVNERLTRVEASPQRLISWAGVGTGCFGVATSCLGVFLSFVAVAVGIITWAIANLHYK